MIDKIAKISDQKTIKQISKASHKIKQKKQVNISKPKIDTGTGIKNSCATIIRRQSTFLPSFI